MHEPAVLVLRFHVAVHELHEKFLFQGNPLFELVLRRLNRVIRNITRHPGKWLAGYHRVALGSHLFLQFHRDLVVQHDGSTVHGMRLVLHLVDFERVNLLPHMRGHDVVHLVAGV